jgi:hypothetical protein
VLLFAAAASSWRPSAGVLPQVPLPLVEDFPRVPSPWSPVDWRTLSADALSVIFDATRRGPYLPLLWWDDTHHNVNSTTFGIPSYVGGATGAGAPHESIAGAAAVLSVAHDAARNVSCLSGGGFTCVDVERMLLNYRDSSSGIWTDSFQPNMSLWYGAWVSALPVFVAGASGSAALLPALRSAAHAWLRVEAALGAPDALSFNVSSVSFSPDGTPHGVPGDSKQYPLPVAAAGVAWLLYATRAALGEADIDAPALLAGSQQALDYLFSLPYDSYWEVLMPLGALVSARMNAERGTAYDTAKLLNFILQDSLPSHYPYRWGWGTMSDVWGAGVDVHGLTGSVSDRDGYAFAMDTFATLASLLPVARYEAQFARALGRYASCATNAARLFFPRFNAPAAQSDWPWVYAAGAGADALAYEGLRKWGFNASSGNITGPYATGDGKAQDGLPTNIAIYGAAYVGLMAALVVPLPGAPPGVAAFNISATDAFHRAVAPTTLVYNGGAVAATVALPLPAGAGACDVYDAVTQLVVARAARPPAVALVVAPDTAAVFVAYRSGANLTHDEAHRWLLADGVVIDWQLAAARQ